VPAPDDEDVTHYRGPPLRLGSRFWPGHVEKDAIFGRVGSKRLIGDAPSRRCADAVHGFCTPPEQSVHRIAESSFSTELGNPTTIWTRESVESSPCLSRDWSRTPRALRLLPWSSLWEETSGLCFGPWIDGKGRPGRKHGKKWGVGKKQPALSPKHLTSRSRPLSRSSTARTTEQASS